jgi:ADP-heptose:LPS heptosyltransferase
LKYFNTGLVARAKKLEPFLLLLLPIKFLLWPIALLLRTKKNRIDIFVADGYLVGDTALIRPLIAACVQSKKSVVYLGGTHAKALLFDLPHHNYLFQWPWATYHYQFRSFWELFKLWFFLFRTQPKTTIEVRGDVRNLVVLYLACSQRLIGYSFTGGKRLIDAEPEYSEKYFHLEKHHEELAALCLPSYQSKTFFVKTESRPRSQRQIALSFAGSLKLKTLSAKIGKLIVECLQQTDIPLIYLSAPNDLFLNDFQIIQDSSIEIWKGDFNSYVKKLSEVSGYLGVDSGGAHIAAMFEIPEVLFFGTQFPSFCAPLSYSQQHILESDLSLSCRPCFGVDCVNAQFQVCYESISQQKIQKTLDTFVLEVEAHYQKNKN